MASEPRGRGATTPFARTGGPAVVVRTALAAGDGQLLDCALEVAETFERENPGVALFAGVAAQAHGLADGDADNAG